MVVVIEPLREARRKDAGKAPRLFEPTRERLRQGRGGRRIRCPQCGWEPERGSLWSCECLCLWNTFDTEGRCPDCGKRWETTQCLRCKEWSPHRAWYAEEDPSP